MHTCMVAEAPHNTLLIGTWQNACQSFYGVFSLVASSSATVTYSTLKPFDAGWLPTCSSVYFWDMRYENEMRSPLRKGTVPSLAMSVPSKDIRMSPSWSSALAGDVGSTLLMYTPFWPACRGTPLSGIGVQAEAYSLMQVHNM